MRRLLPLLLAALVYPTSAGAASAPTITTTKLPQAGIDSYYDQTVGVGGGTKPFHFSLVAGKLPRALTLGSNGEVKGWPQNEGTTTFTVRVVDATGASDTQVLSLTVGETDKQLEIWWAVNPRNFEIDQTFPVAGPVRVYRGLPPFTWSMSGGPPGISIDPDTGYLSGTFTQTGTFSATFTVVDAKHRSASRTYDFNVRPRLQITTTSVPGATVGVPYSVQLDLTSGVSPFRWFLYSGTLPPGLSISSSGLLSGTPTDAGRYGFEIRVTDSVSETTGMGYDVVVSP